MVIIKKRQLLRNTLKMGHFFPIISKFIKKWLVDMEKRVNLNNDIFLMKGSDARTYNTG